MSTLRLTLVGMVSLALLVGLGGPFVAQDDPLAPAFVTGSITQGSPGSWGTVSTPAAGPEIADVDADMKWAWAKYKTREQKLEQAMGAREFKKDIYWNDRLNAFVGNELVDPTEYPSCAFEWESLMRSTFYWTKNMRPLMLSAKNRNTFKRRGWLERAGSRAAEARVAKGQFLDCMATNHPGLIR